MGAADARERPLVGWKAIADELRVSIDTAQKWHGAGMPVAQPGGHRTTVVAFPSVLRAWLEQLSKAKPEGAEEEPIGS